MKRRSFLAALFAAPVLPAVANAAPASDPLDFSGMGDDLDLFKVWLAEDGHLIDGTRCRLQAANIGSISAGKIRSADGRTLIDLGARTITDTDL